jgi:hypothetical protein
MDSFIPCNAKLRPASKTDELKNKSLVSVSGYLSGIYFKAVVWKGTIDNEIVYRDHSNNIFNLLHGDTNEHRKEANYYHIGDILTREMIEEEVWTCKKVNNFEHLPMLMLLRCRTEYREPRVLRVYDELMRKMDSVMIGKSKNDIAFQKAINQANLYLGALKIPFIWNLLRLSVSEMERVAWILWMSNNTEWNLLDDKSAQVTKETRQYTTDTNKSNVYNHQTLSIVQFTQTAPDFRMLNLMCRMDTYFS